MKRKSTTVLVRAPKKFASAGIANLLYANDPVNVQRAQQNRAAAILVRQARMNAMPLQRQSPQEKGFVDLINQGNSFNTTGSVTLLCTVPQGAGVNQRIGKKIMWSSIQMRGLVFANSATTLADAALIIVYDKRPTGALPAVTDILVSASSTSMNNNDNAGRFQIVRRMDWVFAGNSTTPTTGKEIIGFDHFAKFRRPCIFKSAGTGAIGDIEEGALYYVCVGNTTGATIQPSSNLNWRVSFTEN